MSRFNKAQLAFYFGKWEAVENSIMEYYATNNPQARILMYSAIENYLELLEFGGKEVHERSGQLIHVLLPLNGEERLEFVKKRVSSHYSYVQLRALYEETKKKAAGLNSTLRP